MPGRKGQAMNGDYTFGFQGQEMDNEIKGEGNSVNYKYRMHDPRIGRFFAVDPLTGYFPHNSPYAFSENRVIDGLELEGLEVTSFHFDARVGVIITGSVSAGIAWDWGENVAFYMTTGVGGVGGGAQVGVGITHYPTAKLSDLSGHGMSIFLSVSAGYAGGGGGVELLFPGDDVVKMGFTGEYMAGAFAGAGGEYTYTWVFVTTWDNVANVIDELFEIPTKFLFEMDRQRLILERDIVLLDSEISALELKQQELITTYDNIDDASDGAEEQKQLLIDEYNVVTTSLTEKKKKKSLYENGIEGLKTVTNRTEGTPKPNAPASEN